MTVTESNLTALEINLCQEKPPKEKSGCNIQDVYLERFEKVKHSAILVSLM